MTTCPVFAINWDHPAWVWWTLGILIAGLLIFMAGFFRWMVLDSRREAAELTEYINRDHSDYWAEEDAL